MIGSVRGTVLERGPTGEVLIEVGGVGYRRFVPLGALPAGLDAGELAAWTMVGNVLLNLDEMLMKR